MKIIVCSDSHGDLGSLIEIVEAHPTADLLLFLGDGYEEFQQLKGLYPAIPMRGVRGNCDFFPAKEYDIIEGDGVRIFITHGHLFGVKNNLERLYVQAQQRNAEVVLYGHTHQAEIVHRDNILYFCPGSVSDYPHGRPTYGILEITDGRATPQVLPLAGVR